MTELLALRAYWARHRSVGRPTPDVGWEDLDILLAALDALALHHQNEHANCSEYYRAIEEAYGSAYRGGALS